MDRLVGSGRLPGSTPSYWLNKSENRLWITLSACFWRSQLSSLSTVGAQGECTRVCVCVYFYLLYVCTVRDSLLFSTRPLRSVLCPYGSHFRVGAGVPRSLSVRRESSQCRPVWATIRVVVVTASTPMGFPRRGRWSVLGLSFPRGTLEFSSLSGALFFMVPCFPRYLTLHSALFCTVPCFTVLCRPPIWTRGWRKVESWVERPPRAGRRRRYDYRPICNPFSRDSCGAKNFDAKCVSVALGLGVN